MIWMRTMMTDATTIRALLALLVLAATAPAGLEAQTASATRAVGDSATRTGAAERRYRLVEVSGKALPAEVEKDWSCREYVTRGTLTMGADSLWTLRTATREVCGDRAEVDTDVDGGRYAFAGDTIRFYEDDGRNDSDWSLDRDVDLDDLETGSLDANGRLTVRLADGETTATFQP
jgi:hypothetical protein